MQAIISDIEPGQLEVSIKDGVEIEGAELELQVPNVGEIYNYLGRVIADFPHLKKKALTLRGGIRRSILPDFYCQPSSFLSSSEYFAFDQFLAFLTCSTFRWRAPLRLASVRLASVR